jgi:D-3-phosphoglycerate dehydrogenase
MTKPFIVVSDGMDKEIFDQLIATPGLDVHPKSKVSKDELKVLLPKINGLIIRSATCPDKEMLDAAPHLRYIIRAGEGTDNIDKKYCQEKGVKVSNTPGANNNSAAEHAIALMMTLLRKTNLADVSMKKGDWEKSAFTGNELWKKTIGLVGFGRIGQIVCKRLQGFEPSVLFFDPINNSSPFDYAKSVKDVKEIFQKADIISIHTPLLDSTKNLVNKEMLSLMKKDAILVNAARGKIINENDLYEFLKEKKIKGAALDVFANEPLENESKLRSLDNIVITPHLGGSTEEAQFRVGEMALHQIREYFLNNTLLNEVKA